MGRYILMIPKTMFLLIVLLISFDLLLLRKAAVFLGNNYRLVTGTDPIGAGRVVQGSTRGLTWIVGKLRGFIAHYVRNYHPTAWRRLRDYLVSRR